MAVFEIYISVAKLKPDEPVYCPALSRQLCFCSLSATEEDSTKVSANGCLLTGNWGDKTKHTGKSLKLSINNHLIIIKSLSLAGAGWIRRDEEADWR